MAKNRIVLGIVVLIFLGGAGFAAGRLLTGEAGTEAQEPDQPVGLDAALATVQQRSDEDQQKPRFVGELLGIYIAPTTDQWPEQIQREHDELNARGCAHGLLADTAHLDFPRTLNMPSEYVLMSGFPQALACSGNPTSIVWEYTVPGPNKTPANLSIIRGVYQAYDFDIAIDRISATVIGGRDAILMRSNTPDGLAQRSVVIFPEEFGMTAILAFNLPETGLLVVAEAVGLASSLGGR